MINPAQIAVDNPRAVLLGALLLVVFGSLSLMALPRQENPTLEERVASVRTYLPGADPEKVEMLVSKVIEDNVAEVDDLREIFSSSTYGASFLLVQVDRAAPARQRLEEIRAKVTKARASLPPEASPPEVNLRVLRTNTMVLVLTGDRGSELVLREQGKELKRDLETLPGVRRVEVRGLPEEEIRVAVDLRRLSQRAVPLSRVVDSLASRNVRLPAGELDVGATRSSIRTSGAFDRVEEVAATYLGAAPSGLPLLLGDVATVTRRLAEPKVRVRHRGELAVALGIEMLPGHNVVTLGESVLQAVAERRTRLPDGLSIEVVADEPSYVRERLGLLTGSLLTGMALVVTLSLVGMGWRSGIVVSATIPLALMAAMAFQELAGVPLHQISIAALVIALGIVVDESIVVTDNIQRHLDLGELPRDAAIKGLGEIHLAVLAGAATTVAAFIPLMMMEGDIGDFIRSIPVVVSVMLLGSVLVSHFVTPLLATIVNRRQSVRARKNRLWDPIHTSYDRLVRFAVERRRLVLGSFALAVVATLAMAWALLFPPAFFPNADRHQFIVRVELPDGAPVEETDAVMMQISERLASEERLRDWTGFAGADAPKFYYNELDNGRAENRGTLIVNTMEAVPFDETRALAERIDRDLDIRVPGASIVAHVLKQGYAGGDAIRIYITGDDLPVLRELAARVREVAASTPGTANVRDSFGPDRIVLQSKVRDAMANLLGIAHSDVAMALHSALEGVVATTLRDADEEIPIRVDIDEIQRQNVRDLATLPIWSPVAGQTVPLGHVASLEPDWSTREILRWNRKRETSVVVGIEHGYAVLDVASRVKAAVRAQVSLPPQYEVFFAGRQVEVGDSFLTLARAAAAAVLLIYIILVLRFGSLAQPVLILLAIPMGLVGASLGLSITGRPLSFMSLLGMISLTGIAVNDSIVLVDTINRLRSEGTELIEAVCQAGHLRLRAVLMTSVTTIVGLLPLSLGGGEFWAPFGFAVMFGLAGATVLTLVVQPATYVIAARIRAPRRGEQSG